MKIPKHGIQTEGKTFTLNGYWYGMATRYNKQKFYKSHNCRFDNTCGGTEEISAGEFLIAAKTNAKIFNE